MTAENFAFTPRIIRSPLSDFYGGDIESSAAYSKAYLTEISAQGFNGIWMHAELSTLVPTSLFPKVDPGRVKQLRRMVKTAASYGIKVYLYICEPRGRRAEDPFWKKHPEIKGQPRMVENAGPKIDVSHYALCTSTPEVKEYLEEGMYNLFKAVPGLGGIFCITASEFHTHCYSHYPPRDRIHAIKQFNEWARAEFICPRCATRSRSEVVAEIIHLLHRGVKRASPQADVIAWTWSWSIIEDDPQEDLIGRLPSDLILMSDWERGGSKKVCGKIHVVDEYSFSLPGPSPRYRQQLALAKKRGMRMMAKIQIGSTHELVTVPYLPLPHLLGRKLEGLRKHKVDGYLGCWIFGGDVSPMSRLTGLMSEQSRLCAARAIDQVARDEFGETAFAPVVRAWKQFAGAWQEYPFSIPFLYYGPMNYATAYPLSLDLRNVSPFASWRALPRDKKGRLAVGDNLESWTAPFGPRLLVQALAALRKKWDRGVAILEQSLNSDPDHHRLRLEWNLARHISLLVASTMNIATFYPLYREYQQAETAAERLKPMKQLRVIFQSELDLATQDLKLVNFDPRLGYHAEARCHLFTPKDLEDKIKRLKSLLGGFPVKNHLPKCRTPLKTVWTARNAKINPMILLRITGRPKYRSILTVGTF